MSAKENKRKEGLFLEIQREAMKEPLFDFTSYWGNAPHEDSACYSELKDRCPIGLKKVLAAVPFDDIELSLSGESWRGENPIPLDLLPLILLPCH